ncbi:MAG: phosphotransferase family protein [Dehalococcoidia bacterium]|nr:phosphotransferase family protein [Dehalococcoidia bacterium]
MSDEAMTLLRDAVQDALGDSNAEVHDASILAGGAMHDSWGLKARSGETESDLVVRVSTPGRADIEKMRVEYEVLRAMHARGVTAPEPLGMGKAPTGEVYMVMRRAYGDSNPRQLLTGEKYATCRERIIQQIAESAAIIHTVKPEEIPNIELRQPREGQDPVDHERERLLEDYDRLQLNPHPAVEWALRWVQREAAKLKPSGRPICVVHGDLRVGNLMYDENGLTAILDWEGTHASEPEIDLAWLCTRVWRFGQNHLEAGGVTDRETLVQAYERASGTTIDRDRLRVWEVLRNIHWVVVCMMQARSHVRTARNAARSSRRSGRRAADTELEILRLTGVQEKMGHAG